METYHSKRLPAGKRKLTCSKCGDPNDRLPQRYCRICHAANMRKVRPKHSGLSPLAKKAATARAYANVYQQRGKLLQLPCEKCGDVAEKHHDDYDKPLKVRWMCRSCHLAEHRAERNIPNYRKNSLTYSV